MSIWLYVGIHLVLLRSSHVLLFLRQLLLWLMPLTRLLFPRYAMLVDEGKQRRE